MEATQRHDVFADEAPVEKRGNSLLSVCQCGSIMVGCKTGVGALSSPTSNAKLSGARDAARKPTALQEHHSRFFASARTKR
jgi:hypothetical protein